MWLCAMLVMAAVNEPEVCVGPESCFFNDKWSVQKIVESRGFRCAGVDLGWMHIKQISSGADLNLELDSGAKRFVLSQSRTKYRFDTAVRQLMEECERRECEYILVLRYGLVVSEAEDEFQIDVIDNCLLMARNDPRCKRIIVVPSMTLELNSDKPVHAERREKYFQFVEQVRSKVKDESYRLKR